VNEGRVRLGLLAAFVGLAGLLVVMLLLRIATPLGASPAGELAQNDGDPYEPNDDWTHAYTVTAGTLSAYLGHDHDVDWYKVYVAQPRTVLTVTLSNLPADYDLVLYGDLAQTAGGGIGNIQDVGQISGSVALHVSEDAGAASATFRMSAR
jgi:hypothetical protein